MEKAKYDRRGNQVVETKHKTFTRQTNCISWGNIIADTLYGSYIRSPLNTSCNGSNFPPGHLFDFDMKNFIQYFGAHHHIVDFVKEASKARSQSVLLYCIFHWYKKRRIVHGFVVTDWDHNHLETFYRQYNEKSASIIEECKKYLCK